MSEQVATAQPEQAPAPEANPAPAASPSPEVSSSPAPGVAPRDLPQLTLDQMLSKVYDDNPPSAKKTEPVAAPAADPSPLTDQQPAVAAAEPASSPAIGPPNSWSPEVHGVWSKLPPDAQKLIADRESQIHRQISQQGNELKSYQPVKSVLDQFKGTYYPPGREAEFVQQLAVANAALHERPAEVLAELARFYGVDLAKLGQPQTPNGQASNSTVDDLFRDPRFDQLKTEHARELAELKGQVRQMAGHLAEKQKYEQEVRSFDANKAIETFSKGKADWGEVQEVIEQEVRFVQATEPHRIVDRESMTRVLEKAYDRARWATPHIRERILTQERQAEAKKAQEELAKKQADAKRHAASNVRTGAPASAPTVGTKWNDDAQLSAIYDRINSR